MDNTDSPITSLPQELIDHIASYLEPSTLVHFSRINRATRRRIRAPLLYFHNRIHDQCLRTQYNPPRLQSCPSNGLHCPLRCAGRYPHLDPLGPYHDLRTPFQFRLTPNFLPVPTNRPWPTPTLYAAIQNFHICQLTFCGSCAGCRPRSAIPLDPTSHNYILQRVVISVLRTPPCKCRWTGYCPRCPPFRVNVVVTLPANLFDASLLSPSELLRQEGATWFFEPVLMQNRLRWIAVFYPLRPMPRLVTWRAQTLAVFRYERGRLADRCDWKEVDRIRRAAWRYQRHVEAVYMLMPLMVLITLVFGVGESATSTEVGVVVLGTILAACVLRWRWMF